MASVTLKFKPSTDVEFQYGNQVFLPVDVEGHPISLQINDGAFG
jgi:hypothetical protein